VLLFGETPDSGKIELAWDGGGSLSIPVGSAGTDDTVWLLQGARLITDWESRYPAAEALAPLDKRKQSRVAARLKELSGTYGLASREMSLVAVVKRDGDRSGQLPETRIVPVGMPQDTAFGAYFHAPGGAPASAATGAFTRMLQSQAVPSMSMPQAYMPPPPMPLAPAAKPSSPGDFTKLLRSPVPPQQAMAPPSPPATGGRSVAARFLARVRSTRLSEPEQDEQAAPATPTTEDSLLALASAMDSDGGMPGRNADDRGSAGAVALLAFVVNGHTPSSGAFRTHVARLMKFLQSLAGLNAAKRGLLDQALSAAQTGKSPSGDWLILARSGGDRWGALAKAFNEKK
jgi:hypothetical protein